MTKVLDAWAMMAWLLDQPSADLVEGQLQLAESGDVQLFMSWINVGEVFYTLVKRRNRASAENFLPTFPR